MRPCQLHAALLVLLAASAHAYEHDAPVFDVRNYGGVGDGITLNTAPFQRAIAAAHASYLSSGTPATVLATQGIYLSGQIVLLSGVSLSVTSSCSLRASANVSDYPSNQTQWAFIWAEGAAHIGIHGDTPGGSTGGTIDGQFQAYIAGFDPVANRYLVNPWPGCTGECRPRLVKLALSTDVTVTGVTLTGSPDWTFHLWGCSRVLVQYLQQYGDGRWPNNDGIDIDSSQDVAVLDSSFDTADDAVCIKSTAGMQDTSNLTVRNCSLRSRSGAIKFGSATPVPIHDCLFEDIVVWDSNRGLAVQQRDGGDVYNVLFRNILVNGTRLWPFGWWGAGEPIYLSSMPRAPGLPVGATYNVSFINITAFSQGPAVLTGRAPGQPLAGISLTNVSLTIDRWQGWNYSDPLTPPTIDYEPTSAVSPYRVNATGWMPALYVEGITTVSLTNVSLSFNSASWQAYWGTECLNTTAAGGRVDSNGVSCVPPVRPPT